MISLRQQLLGDLEGHVEQGALRAHGRRRFSFADLLRKCPPNLLLARAGSHGNEARLCVALSALDAGDSLRQLLTESMVLSQSSAAWAECFSRIGWCRSWACSIQFKEYRLPPSSIVSKSTHAFEFCASRIAFDRRDFRIASSAEKHRGGRVDIAH